MIGGTYSKERAPEREAVAAKRRRQMADAKRKAEAGDKRAAALYAALRQDWGGFGLKNLPYRVYSDRTQRAMRARLPSWLLRLCDGDVATAMAIRADSLLAAPPPRKPGPRYRVENPSAATKRQRRKRERDKRQSAD